MGTAIVQGDAGSAKLTSTGVGDWDDHLEEFDRILLTCETDLYETVKSNVANENRFGSWVDGVFKDNSIVLTVKDAATTDDEIVVYEPIPTSISATCSVQLANEHIVYRHLATQARPNGDWEKWKGDFKGTNTKPGRGPTMNTIDDEYLVTGKDYNKGAKMRLGDYGQDEGHFYMECSNQGLCDRSSGLCECFDGYTGRARQRQACPEDCSGHGVCLSVDQLRLSEMTKLPLTASTTRDDKTITFDSNVWSVKLRPGDYIKIGNYPPMKINTIAADAAGADGNYNVTHFLSGLTAQNSAAIKVDTVELYNAFPETLPMGTEVYQVHSYDLWDSDKNMACKCDPRWTGYDCSERKCPLGDDPLTVDSVDGQGTTTTTDDSMYT